MKELDLFFDIFHRASIF